MSQFTRTHPIRRVHDIGIKFNVINPLSTTIIIIIIADARDDLEFLALPFRLIFRIEPAPLNSLHR